MCLVRSDTPAFSVNLIDAWLSQCIVDVVLTLSNDNPRRTHILCFDAKARATYSAKVVESETFFCFFDCHTVVCPKV